MVQRLATFKHTSQAPSTVRHFSYQTRFARANKAKQVNFNDIKKDKKMNLFTLADQTKGFQNCGSHESNRFLVTGYSSLLAKLLLKLFYTSFCYWPVSKISFRDKSFEGLCYYCCYVSLVIRRRPSLTFVRWFSICSFNLELKVWQ